MTCSPPAWARPDSAAPLPPGFVDPLNPTAEELRRLAIYNNYRALVDPTPGGGYGTLYGPNVDAHGTATLGEGKIAGDEYIAFEPARRRQERHDDGAGAGQLRSVASLHHYGALSGSRGVYGAIATAGEWGLKRGCAVAYTDKGTGTGAHDLQTNTVNLIARRARRCGRGAATTQTSRPDSATPSARPSTRPRRTASRSSTRTRSRTRRRTGAATCCVDRVRVLRAQPASSSRRTSSSTSETRIVIASSVSNGGGASVRAVEQDNEGLIDGLAVGEPNVNPKFKTKLLDRAGRDAPLIAHSQPLIDYTTLVNVYQGCASLAPANLTAPLNLAGSAGRTAPASRRRAC